MEPKNVASMLHLHYYHLDSSVVDLNHAYSILSSKANTYYYCQKPRCALKHVTSVVVNVSNNQGMT